MASFETFESDVSEKQCMEAAVNSLLKEGDEFCDEVEKCFDESLDECNLLKGPFTSAIFAAILGAIYFADAIAI